MVNMQVVKLLNCDIYRCIFFEEGNISEPLLVLTDYELRNFYNLMEEEKKAMKEEKR